MAVICFMAGLRNKIPSRPEFRPKARRTASDARGRLHRALPSAPATST
jgi:hypothetical protein